MGAEVIKSFATAMAFLTRIPIAVDVSSDDLARSVPWFPMVGLLIGALVGSVYAVLAGSIGGLAAAGMAVGVGIMVTGAIHEDGLADTFDGFGGGATKDRVLEIMKDSRLGTFGTSALVSVLVVRLGLISQLTSTESAIRVIAVAAIMSRVGTIGVMGVSRAVGATGLAASYLAALRSSHVIAGCGAGILVTALLVGLESAAVAVVVVALMAALLRLWSYRRIRGITGDVLGMVQQLTELGLLIVAVAALTGGVVSW